MGKLPLVFVIVATPAFAEADLLARTQGLSRIEAKVTNLQRGGLGTVMLATFSVWNGNGFTARDIVFECDMLGRSGTKIETLRTTVYDTFPPMKWTKIRNLNMGFVHSQASGANCRVVDYES